jgi:hypothetical protein
MHVFSSYIHTCTGVDVFLGKNNKLIQLKPCTCHNSQTVQVEGNLNQFLFSDNKSNDDGSLRYTQQFFCKSQLFKVKDKKNQNIFPIITRLKQKCFSLYYNNKKQQQIIEV